MSFKPKNAKIDLTLDMSDYLLEEDTVEKASGGLILPVRIPTAEVYLAWAEKVTEDLKKNKEDSESDGPTAYMDSMLDQIDYWYGKGKDFWIKRCPFPVIQEILDFLNTKVATVQKK